jgi:hyperosmotically inducible protein
VKIAVPILGEHLVGFACHPSRPNLPSKKAGSSQDARALFLWGISQKQHPANLPTLVDASSAPAVRYQEFFILVLANTDCRTFGLHCKVESRVAPDFSVAEPSGFKLRVGEAKREMRSHKLFISIVALIVLGCVSACSTAPTKSPDVADNIRTALDQANFKDVSVSQDRDKGVVTLTGTTASEADKAQAESIAKSIAGSQVVANEIAVRPPGNESVAKKVNSDLDKAIEQNLHALLVQNKLDKAVKYDVKNGVVTLTGNVNSQTRRAMVEKLATGVPNVQQVVNELQVKNQKATSSS